MSLDAWMTMEERLWRIDRKLDRVVELLKAVLKEEKHMSVELDALEIQVQKNEDVEQSAITLIQGIAAQLAAIANDPVKVKALSDSLAASADALAAAVAANTPVA